MKRSNIRRKAGLKRDSLYKGVYRHREKWQAKINIFGRKNVNLGRFSTQEEAALNYDFYVIKIYGKDFYLNFPDKDYSSFVPKMDIFLPKTKKVVKKRKNWGRKLNKTKAREIRAKYNNQKLPIKKLAQEYKVTFATISRILHNITYRDKDFSKVYVIHNPKVN
jgi:hypothetical protein